MPCFGFRLGRRNGMVRFKARFGHLCSDIVDQRKKLPPTLNTSPIGQVH